LNGVIWTLTVSDSSLEPFVKARLESPEALDLTIATGAALVALILTFGPISGAHFNPAVTLADASERGLPCKSMPDGDGLHRGEK
jgi:glycerol uptake facilitator-like aquaporin